MGTIETVRTNYQGRYIEKDLSDNIVFVCLGASRYEWCVWGVYSNNKSVAKFRVKRLKNIYAPN